MKKKLRRCVNSDDMFQHPKREIGCNVFLQVRKAVSSLNDFCIEQKKIKVKNFKKE